MNLAFSNSPQTFYGTTNVLRRDICILDNYTNKTMSGSKKIGLLIQHQKVYSVN